MMYDFLSSAALFKQSCLNKIALTLDPNMAKLQKQTDVY